jgi:hypothetical protein
MNVSPYEAWRFGVTLRLNTSQSGENSNMITNVNGTPQSNSSETTYSTLLNAYYIKYVPAKRYVYFYYGGGPVIGYGYQSYYKDNFSYNGATFDKSSTDYKSNTLNVGAGAVFGSEIFVVKGVSLSAEYSANAVFTYMSVEHNQTSPSPTPKYTDKIKSTSFQFSNYVKMGLSIYF